MGSYCKFIKANVLNGQCVLFCTYDRWNPQCAWLVDHHPHLFVHDIEFTQFLHTQTSSKSGPVCIFDQIQDIILHDLYSLVLAPVFMFWHSQSKIRTTDWDSDLNFIFLHKLPSAYSVITLSSIQLGAAGLLIPPQSFPLWIPASCRTRSQSCSERRGEVWELLNGHPARCSSVFSACCHLSGGWEGN